MFLSSGHGAARNGSNITGRIGTASLSDSRKWTGGSERRIDRMPLSLSKIKRPENVMRQEKVESIRLSGCTLRAPFLPAPDPLVPLSVPRRTAGKAERRQTDRCPRRCPLKWNGTASISEPCRFFHFSASSEMEYGSTVLVRRAVFRAVKNKVRHGTRSRYA